MNKDDIILMARQLGFPHYYQDGSIVNIDIIERLVNLCMEIQREKIALKIEEMGIEGYGTLAIAAAIRSDK